MDSSIQQVIKIGTDFDWKLSSAQLWKMSGRVFKRLIAMAVEMHAQILTVLKKKKKKVATYQP